jgi:hypothetical protein
VNELSLLGLAGKERDVGCTCSPRQAKGDEKRDQQHERPREERRAFEEKRKELVRPPTHVLQAPLWKVQLQLELLDRQRPTCVLWIRL